MHLKNILASPKHKSKDSSANICHRCERGGQRQVLKAKNVIRTYIHRYL